MHTRRFHTSIFGTTLRPHSAALAILIMLMFLILGLLFILLTAQPAQGQTYKVIYNFTGGADGAYPEAGLTMDVAGNLYGTTEAGGHTGGNCYDYGCGTAFKLAYKNSGWVLTTLYTFQAGSDGSFPAAPLVIGPNGILYGATGSGGSGCSGYGCGTVFSLRPAPTVCKTALCPWTETVLYRFADPPDGANPAYGDLIFDQAGNIYGTTAEGGTYGDGAVYQLALSGGVWTESVLHSFDQTDGAEPAGGVTFGKDSSLYGTTVWGGSHGGGTIYELTPSGSGWTETTLHNFDHNVDGNYSTGGLIFDSSGNLYGTTGDGGPGGGIGGTAFQLTPDGTLNTICVFNGGFGPVAGLIMDHAGNLYGTAPSGGAYGVGIVFKLTPSNGGWTETVLHDFSGIDGSAPYGKLLLDGHGNLYGTAGGGVYGYGVVFEITLD
jgi:uncharacterized repeat protein (TIGR03803 family)